MALSSLLLTVVLLLLTSKTEGCSSGAIRLTGGSVPNEGRVEVCVGGRWGTVCRDSESFDQVEIRVICRQLGLSIIGAKYLDYSRHTGLDDTIPILMDEVECSGNEERLIDCGHSRQHGCIHWEDAAVHCKRVTCVDGDLRLQDGLSVYEGRLEVCHNELWGTICDDVWNQQASNVACRQLGFNGTDYARILKSDLFSATSSGTPVILDNVECTGNESALINCQHHQIGSSNCNHTDVVNLRCGQCSEYDVRLMDGVSGNEGRVEVCVSGGWGTVCHYGWDTPDAMVVCRQLRLPSTASQAVNGEVFQSNPSLPIVMDSVQCNGKETSLGDCEYNSSISCSHMENAGVRCFNELSSSPVTSALPETSTPDPQSSPSGPESSPFGPESSVLYVLITVIVVLMVLCVIVMVVCIMVICVYKKRTHSIALKFSQINPLEMQKKLPFPDDKEIYDYATTDRIYETIPDTIPPPPPPPPFPSPIVQPPDVTNSSYQDLVMPLNPDHAYAALEDTCAVVEDEKRSDGIQCDSQLATGDVKEESGYQELRLATKNSDGEYTRLHIQP